MCGYSKLPHHVVCQPGGARGKGRRGLGGCGIDRLTPPTFSETLPSHDAISPPTETLPDDSSGTSDDCHAIYPRTRQTTGSRPKIMCERLLHQVCVCACVHACMRACMRACVRACMCVYVHVHVCMYVFMFVCMYLCLYVCIYVCMYVCICTYILTV